MKLLSEGNKKFYKGKICELCKNKSVHLIEEPYLGGFLGVPFSCIQIWKCHFCGARYGK